MYVKLGFLAIPHAEEKFLWWIMLSNKAYKKYPFRVF